jgi:hypothetical protein
MKAGAAVALALLLLVSAPFGSVVAGAPAVSITSPKNGAMLLARSVEVTGTALGSSVDWQEALQDDFDLGILENLTNDVSGTLSLNRTVYDTFDGPVVDPARWSVSQGNGLGATEAGGELQLSGTGMADGWSSLVTLISTAAVSDRINGTLKQFMEVGTGAYSVIGLYQDESNYLAVGRGYDFYGLGPGQKVVLLSSVSGCFTMESLGAATNAPHNFVVTHDGTDAVLYMDGSQLASRAIALSGARCMLRAAVNATADFVSSSWDDVSCLFFTSGRFTSAAYDTLSVFPEVSGVAWTASVPAGQSLSVQLRSADNPDMDGASGWVTVSNGQSSGFPAFRQYLQYTVLFGTPGNGTALFRDITVRYGCDVRTVEVSIDNRFSWARATGKEDWNISLNIPDGPCLVWARVTDVTGDVQVVSIAIDVDATEPSASLLINDGSAMTPRPAVNLTITAYDAYGVSSMIISEDEGFPGAEWQPYAGRLGWNLSAGDGPKTVFAKVRDSNGWESETASATITVDTRPPTGTIRINAGANYTRSSTVTLYLNASDESGVSDMLLSNRVDLSGENWLPYTPVYTWNLQLVNGVRTVYARFRDTAGHLSMPVSATVTLDTVQPVFSFTIENGSTYATSYQVELQLNATDNNAMGGMLISSSSQFHGAAWEPWSPARQLTLPGGEGPTNLYAKVRDAAENEAAPQTASILVDTVAPLCVVSSLPATVASTSFTVSWNGNDATSGLVGYDVQYREGTGAWTDWLRLVNSTTAAFTGKDGLSYMFRARAHDLAGNVGAYPDNPKTTTTIRLEVPGSRLPVVSILTPMSSAPYNGKVTFSGTAHARAAARSILSVQWQIDDGAWLNAAGTENWSFEWNTLGASTGPHTLRVRSFDGQDHSAVAERTVSVDNPVENGGGGGTDLMPILLVLGVVIVAGALAGVFVMKRRKRAPVAPAPERVSPTAAAAEIAAPASPGGDRARTKAGPANDADDVDSEPGGQLPEAAPVTAGETADATAAATAEAPEGAAPAASDDAQPTPAQAPSALPPLQSTPRPPLELVRQIDPAQILSVVKALYFSLPGELQFMQPDVIAQLVVTGEQGKAKSGDTLVLIMNRWYFSDETKANFLQRYNW